MKVLAPSRLVLVEGRLRLSRVHASPAPSPLSRKLLALHYASAKLFRTAILRANLAQSQDLLFWDSARGHCIESAEGALGRTSLPHCNVGCAETLCERRDNPLKVCIYRINI